MHKLCSRLMVALTALSLSLIVSCGADRSQQEESKLQNFYSQKSWDHSEIRVEMKSKNTHQDVVFLHCRNSEIDSRKCDKLAQIPEHHVANLVKYATSDEYEQELIENSKWARSGKGTLEGAGWAAAGGYIYSNPPQGSLFSSARLRGYGRVVIVGALLVAAGNVASHFLAYNSPSLHDLRAQVKVHEMEHEILKQVNDPDADYRVVNLTELAIAIKHIGEVYNDHFLPTKEPL